MTLTEEAKAARREYYRKWARKNRDKLAANQERYWTKKYEQLHKEGKI